MRKEILDKLREKLISDDRDAVLVSSHENQLYVSGFDYCDGYILVLKNTAILFADFRYIEAARACESAKEFEIIMPEGGMLSAIGVACAANGIERVFVEDETLSCNMLEKLKGAAGRVAFCGGASAAFTDLRSRKTEWELDVIARAQKITDMAFSHIVDMITPDMTEIDVALELEFFMRRNGAQRAAFDTIAVSGGASSMPHGVPRNVKLEKGFLTMDFGACIDGYASDMTRTIVVGKADENMKKLYNTVLCAQKAALEVIAEGAECRSIDAVARNIINSQGYVGCFGHGLGHGVGLYVHEAPRLSPAVAQGVRLERGNVVTVEPGIYIEGKYGCRIEDMVAIGLDGKPINFTKSPKELIEI